MKVFNNQLKVSMTSDVNVNENRLTKKVNEEKQTEFVDEPI